MVVRLQNAEAGQDAGVLERHAAVLSQLTKVLGSPHFRNSKRSQALLGFVVKAALAGDNSSMKERCIGAAVFGREPAYDTGQDPIVRNTALDVRKRLAQYYLDPEHACELRIDLPLGSYLPTFTLEQAPLPEPPKSGWVVRGLALKWVFAAALVIVIAAVFFIGGARRTTANEFESFWDPMFRDRKTIQICIGQPTRLYRFVGPRTEELNGLLGAPASRDRQAMPLTVAPNELTWVAPEYLYLRDALSAFNVGSWIQSKGRSYHMMSVATTNYSQLRHTPLVAIGAFNNPWAIRVTAELRFVFDRRTINGVIHNCIIDRRNPNATDWKVAQPVAGPVSEDYAIVTRVFDPATENTVISAAGIETYGTLAASEFVTQREYLGVALRAIPSDWRHKNVQFVLGTKIIDGTPGPPRVLATHTW